MKKISISNSVVMILMLVAFYSCNSSKESNSSNQSKDCFDEIIPKEVTIGKQVWMTKNLNVDKFRNGDPIPQAKTEEEWNKAGENRQPAWCYYDNDPSNGEKYGKLYNWYTVNDPRGLAPVGFHVPSYAEWKKLVDYLGGDAGKKMKSKCGWKDASETCPNCVNWNSEYRSKVPCHTCKDTRYVLVPFSGNGSNDSHFFGLPGGYRYDDGGYNDVGNSGGWWSSSEFGTLNAWNRYLFNYYGFADRGNGSKKGGLSVRCLRD